LARAMLFFFMFILAALNADCPEVAISKIPEMNGKELADLNGKEVRMRGFLYTDSRQRLVLDTSPNLKSCCVGSEKNIERQVVVKDLLGRTDSGSPVLIQGTFLIQPEFGDSGKMIQYAVLSRSQLVVESPWSGIAAFVGILGVFPAFFIARKFFLGRGRRLDCGLYFLV
jgi:hypothetical protein